MKCKVDKLVLVDISVIGSMRNQKFVVFENVDTNDSSKRLCLCLFQCESVKIGVELVDIEISCTPTYKKVLVIARDSTTSGGLQATCVEVRLVFCEP